MCEICKLIQEELSRRRHYFSAEWLEYEDRKKLSEKIVDLLLDEKGHSKNE